MSEEGDKPVEDAGKKVTVTLTDDDIKAINDDLKATKESFVSTETDKIKADVKKEFEVQKELEEAQKAKEELEKKLQQKEQDTAKKFEEFQNKIDNMISSKATIVSENPFETKESMSNEVDKWSEDKVNEFEEKSARAFFGSSYDTRA